MGISPEVLSQIQSMTSPWINFLLKPYYESLSKQKKILLFYPLLGSDKRVRMIIKWQNSLLFVKNCFI